MNVALSQPARSKITADLIILNATVRTMVTNHPLAQAVAMTGNRILAVGATQEIAQLAGAQTRTLDAMLRIGGLKGFSDGSLGSSTALLFEPYVDSPETRGLPGEEMFPEGAMFKRVLEADRAGLQVMIHAIGDRANDQILAIFEQVTRTNSPRDRRFRIEHAQHLRPQDIPRFAHAQVTALPMPAGTHGFEPFTISSPPALPMVSDWAFVIRISAISALAAARAL